MALYAQFSPWEKRLQQIRFSQPACSLPAAAPLEREFVRMVTSRTGQEVVVKDGHIPRPAQVALKQLEQIGAASVASN